MIELLTLLALFGGLLYRTHIALAAIYGISALTSAFFFINFLTARALRQALLFGIAVVLGAHVVRFHEDRVTQAFFQVRTVSGIVQSIDRRLDKTLVVVRDTEFKKDIQATVRSRSALLPGDTVTVSGMIERPEDFLTDTGRLFDYDGYLQSKGIRGVVRTAFIKPVSSGGVSLIRTATLLRFYIASVFTRYIAFPIDGIISGMLVGYQGSIPDFLQDLFRNTGVLHVLVLSGENITLLAVFLSIVLKPLPFRVRSVAIGFAVILIVLVSGAGVAAMRSGIMGIIALSAGLFKRPYVPFRAITISTILFFFYSPETIYVDPGFHLSILATLFMVVVMPKIEPLCSFLPKKYAIRELLILAIAVPIFMLPHTMYFSGIEPVAAPFANILMSLAVPVFMLMGAAVLALSWCTPAAKVVGIVAAKFGTIVILLLKQLNRLPQLQTPPLAWWGVIGTYMLFFCIVFRKELMQFLHELHSSVPPRSSSSEKESQ
jgi:competence protein ComEC